MTYNLLPYVNDARKELKTKTLDEIQQETALKWCGRAIVAVQIGRDDDAHEYAHEALEHAGLASDVNLYLFVRNALNRSGITP